MPSLAFKEQDRHNCRLGMSQEMVHLPPKTATNFSSKYRICLMYIKFLAFKRFLRKQRGKVVAFSSNPSTGCLGLTHCAGSYKPSSR